MKLIDRLPLFYNDSIEVIDLQASLENEILEIEKKMKELTSNLFVITSKNISEWENFVGIKSNVTKNIDFRKTNVIAKIRGQGTTTKELIENVAISFSNGEVEVMEDSPNYSFKIKFIGTKGIPPNMEDLILTIEEIKPAHLDFTFEYTYLTWDEYENYNKTADEWDALNLTWDEFEKYREVM